MLLRCQESTYTWVVILHQNRGAIKSLYLLNSYFFIVPEAVEMGGVWRAGLFVQRASNFVYFSCPAVCCI